MKWLHAAILASALLARTPPVFAQQSVEYGSIGGRVLDTSGAVLAGAEVSARHADTNVTSTTATDGSGRFRFAYLRIGRYSVTISHRGFDPATRDLTLNAGSAFELTIELPVAGLSSSVTVNADATMIETARTQIAATVAEAEVRNVPLNGRNFLELALLVPGVAPANVSGTQLFPETSAVPGVSLSVGSQRNLSNNFIVDGLSANDDAAALSGIAYGLDAVEQFQVVTSGAQAELGRALGGYVSVVTKSGTNRLQGTAYEYFRDDWLTASNQLSGERLPMRQSQFGASLGGPVIPNRTFYFGNVERRSLEQTGLTTIAEETVAAINSRLRDVGYGGPLVATGQYDDPVGATNLFGKIDHHVSGRDQLTARYTLYRVDATRARGAGALNSSSAATDLENLDQTLAVSNTLTLSPKTVLETRVQVAHGNLSAPPTDPIGPAVTIAGTAVFGTSSGSPTRRVNTLYQIVNNVSYQGGPHAIRGGIDFTVNDDRITYPRASRGSYTFASLDAFLAGNYNNLGFTQTFGPSIVSQVNPNLGVFVQDEWKLSSALTMNAGVRYDLQFLETIEADINNLSPRLGLAWSPFDQRRTIVRAGAGLFFDRVPLRPLANAILSAENTTDLSRVRQVIVSLSPSQAGAPAFPSILPSVVTSGTLVNLTTMDRQLQNAYSRQANLEVEQQLSERTSVSVAYEYVRGVNLLISINQNVPRCAASGTNNGCRPIAEYANNNQYSAAGESSYHGLHVSLTRRPSNWGQYRISYTLSSGMNNIGEFFFSAPIDPFDLSKDWGRSDNDQRHLLVLNGSVETSAGPAGNLWRRLADGWQLSGLLQAYSSAPFNITSGVTTIQGTAGRPLANGDFIARNAGSSSPFVTLNARVSRSFRLAGRLELQAIAEGFNLTNHVNVVARNGNFGTGAYPDQPAAGFGRVTAVGDPRSFQLATRLVF